MTRFFSALFATFIIFSVTSPVYAEERESAYDRVIKTRTIRCGYQAWPPAFIKDPNSSALSGINYDFMEAIGRELNLKIEWVAEVGSGDAITALDAGKFDIMCSSMWPDPGRLFHAEYTAPTYYSAIYPYVRADDTRFDNNMNAANQSTVKIGGIEGDITLDVARKAFPNAEHIALPQMSDGSQMILSLVSGKVDMILIDDPLALDFSKNNPDKIRKVSGSGPARMFGEHLLLPNGEIKLLNIMNITIGTLIASGEMDRILDKYEPQYPGSFTRVAKQYETEK